MNKHIEEIQNNTYVDPHDSWNEAFANAIIQRCVEVIDAQLPGVHELPAYVVLNVVKRNVKAYFGVDQ